MKLIYLYHSGFALLCHGFTVVMDYFEDSVSPEAGILHDSLLGRPGPLYVLASHFHADHFSKRILEWQEKRPDVFYILSREIVRKNKLFSENVLPFRKGDSYADDNLTVRAFGSTDVGVSFLLGVEGKKLFHAGDLNNWHWMDESTEAEWRGYEKNFLRELEELAACASALDVALFPVDPRLGSAYMRGPLQFVERIKTTIFVPMHFDEAYDKANAFGPLAAGCGTRVPEMYARGQEIDLSPVC